MAFKAIFFAIQNIYVNSNPVSVVHVSLVLSPLHCYGVLTTDFEQVIVLILLILALFVN